MFGKKLLLILILVLLLLPSIAFAVGIPGWPLVPCGLSQDRLETPNINESKSCGRCDLFQLLKNLIDFVIGGLMPPLAVLLFVWAGFLILLSGANPGLYAQGQTIFKNTFYGIMVLLSAWMITNTLILSVGSKYNNAGNWWQFTCTESAPVSPPVITPPSGQTPLGGNCSGVQCSDSNLNVCGQNTSANCSESAVNTWDTQIRAAAARNQIGSGIDTVALIKAVMSQESGGRTNVNASDGLSYGIMQLRPTTADQFKSGCTSANITPTWLNDQNNVQASVCIAISYLKSLVGSCGASVRNLAAGYNGGGAAKGACDFSQSCASCSICGNEKTRRWECLWDGPDGEHKVCNIDRGGSSFNATRKYVPKVSYCYTKFGGTATQPPVSSNLSLASISPTTFPAGTERSFNQQTGVVEYTYLEVPFEVQGQDLDGATLSSNNVGVDGKPGVEFKNLQLTNTSIKGIMLMHPTAKDGKTIITASNAGKTATKEVDVTITGTQYLKRKFASNPNIFFLGNYREIIPNQDIIDLEKAIKDGLLHISSNAYKKLDLGLRIYEESYWLQAKECGTLTSDANGCADRLGIIFLRGNKRESYNNSIAETIFHEAAHQLHFFNIGEFYGMPNPPPPSNFQREWDLVTGPVNSSTCDHLPLVDWIIWKDGHSDEPNCSFIWAYGAYLRDGESVRYEDITTMAAKYIFKPEVFNSSEVKGDSRYNRKVNLLKSYEFLK